MLVVPKRKALILKLRDPDRVTNIIPTAKVMEWKGERFVALPHRLDEVRVLRNLGFAAPSPIRYYYHWPRGAQFDPFDAQLGTAEFLTLSGNAFVLNELGTGKTLSALCAYDYLREIGQVDKVLVIAPLSTLERTWADEIFMNFPHLNCAVLHCTAQKRLKLLAQDFDVYIINHDGIKATGFADAMKERPDINLVIVDEVAQVARSSGSDRWKALNRICNKQVPRRVWGMTGTPTPNSPEDAWAQCKLVNPDTVPPYFKRFQDMVMRQVGPFRWIPRPNAMEVVYDAIQPAVRYTRDECVDLPPCLFETRTLELTTEQKKAYKEMMNTLKAEVAAGEVLAVNEAVKMQKLLQICCGVAYGPQGEHVAIDCTNRMALVKEIIEEAGTKVIVFVPFVASVKAVHEYLVGEGISAEMIYGQVSKSERDRIFGAFQHDVDPRVLVAQPSAMSHGLTLTAASTIVWYAPVTSNETYEQANGRITRPGQKNTQFIINIEGAPIERKLYERLKNRQAMQRLLLAMVEQGVVPA